MTIFTWAWVDGARTNEVYRAPLPTPTDIKPTVIHPAGNFRESRSKVYCCRFKLKNSRHTPGWDVYTALIRFTSKHLVLKRIPRIFKLKEQ